MRQHLQTRSSRLRLPTLRFSTHLETIEDLPLSVHRLQTLLGIHIKPLFCVLDVNTSLSTINLLSTWIEYPRRFLFSVLLRLSNHIAFADSSEMQFFSAWFKAMVVIATLISIVLARPISSANLTPSRTTNLIDRAAQPDPITQSTSTSTAGTYGDTNYAGAYASNEGSNSASGAICGKRDGAHVECSL